MLKTQAREIIRERLNDPGEQAAGYPMIDELEERIDLVATDILRGWRNCHDPDDSLFRDAFARAFDLRSESQGLR